MTGGENALKRMCEDVMFGDDAGDVLRAREAATALSDTDLAGAALAIHGDECSEIGFYEGLVLEELAERFTRRNVTEVTLAVPGTALAEVKTLVSEAAGFLGYVSGSLDGVEREKAEALAEKLDGWIRKFDPAGG